MRAFVSEMRGRTTVVIEGEVDHANAEELTHRFESALQRSRRELAADLGQVTYIDSGGIGVLYQVLEWLPQGSSLLIVRPQPPVARILELAGLLSIPSVRLIRDWDELGERGHSESRAV